MSGDGDLAQRLMAESLAFHPAKDERRWFIRTRVAAGGGWDFSDTEIIPKISPLLDREAQLHGQAVQTGDVKITVAGTVEITAATELVTVDGTGLKESWRVYYVHTELYQGVPTEKRCFVRPRNQETV